MLSWAGFWRQRRCGQFSCSRSLGTSVPSAGSKASMLVMMETGLSRDGPTRVALRMAAGGAKKCQKVPLAGARGGERRAKHSSTFFRDWFCDRPRCAKRSREPRCAARREESRCAGRDERVGKTEVGSPARASGGGAGDSGPNAKISECALYSSTFDRSPIPRTRDARGGLGRAWGCCGSHGRATSYAGTHRARRQKTVGERRMSG